MTPTFESAWQTDEGIRWKENLIKHEIREKWRKVCIANDEHKLPEYPRPLKYIPESNKKPLSLKKFLLSCRP